MKVHKRAYQQVNGLRVWWEDKHPLDDRTKQENSGVGHKNFVLRPYAGEIFRITKDWATERKPLMWEITLTVVFTMPDGHLMEEARIIRAHGTIAELATVFPEEIREAIAEGEDLGGQYITTKFHLECLGDTPPAKTNSNEETI